MWAKSTASSWRRCCPTSRCPAPPAASPGISGSRPRWPSISTPPAPGWLYALEVGRALIRAGTARKLLVVTAELLSRITNPNDHGTAFLFGDGAGAAVLVDKAGGHRLNRMHLSGDASFFEAIQRTGGGAMRPVPQANGDDLHHFYLQMNGGVVFKNAVIAFGDIIEDTLQRHQLKPEDVQWVVPHQANERILKAVSKRVGHSVRKICRHPRQVRQHLGGVDFDGAGMGGRGGDFQRRRQDHLLRRGRGLHLRRRPAHVVG